MNKVRVLHKGVNLRWLRRLGLPGAVGIVLLCMGGFVYLMGILPAQNALKESTASALRLQQLVQEPVIRPPTLEDSLNKLTNHFADLTEASSILASILATAKDGQISIETFQVRNDDSKSTFVQRRVITLPVHGEYLAVRKWLDMLLKKHPSISLDDLDIRRARVDSSMVQAKVGLSIWFKPSTSPAPIPVVQKSAITGSEKLLRGR